MILLLMACAPAECEEAPTWEGWTEGFFVQYCQSCHASDAPQRFGAPAWASFDDEESARALEEELRRTVLEERSMPLGGGVSEEELARLDLWLECPP